MTSSAQQRQNLKAQRDELRQRLEKIAADYRRGLSSDLEDQAIELENAETIAEIERVTRLRLTEVENELMALGRTT